MHPVTSVTIVHDASCRLCTRLKVRLCTRLKVWIGRQPSVVCLRFAASGSVEARTKFSDLPSGELAVVAETGGGVARQSCRDCLSVGAVRPPRPCLQVDQPALHAGGPRGIQAVSRNHFALSSMLRLSSDRAIEQHLRQAVVPKCQIVAK